VTALDGPNHFDLVIIGTGSGNSILSSDFDSWRVAIVEEGVFGGTCLNRGCIPTKMFVHAADAAETVRHSGHLGIDATIDAVRWRDIRDRVFDRIDPIAAGGEEYRTHRCANVTVFKGRGAFTGMKQLAVTAADGTVTTITGTQFVLAAGARPMIPSIEGLDKVTVHTSDSVMRLDDLPARMTIVGGGFIAVELAHVFASFGVAITIVHRSSLLLRQHEHEVAQVVTSAFRKRTNLLLNRHPVAVTEAPDGVISLTLDDGSVVECEVLLVTTGRIPNSDILNVTATGVSTHADGRVIVDEHQRTVVEGIWALGDLSSPHMLKHVANHEGRITQHNLLHPEAPKRTDHRFVPAAVFTRPQVASVGLTEAQARAAGIDVVCKIQAYGDVAYGWAMEDRESFVKLVADRATKQLVGAHIVGPQSSTLIQQLITAMRFGIPVDELAADQYWIHPALPEVIENALLGLDFSTPHKDHA
jgi:mycothione reductase